MILWTPSGWEAQAACRVIPDGYTARTWIQEFYPPSTGGRRRGGAGNYPVTRPVCAACPVRIDCLEDALAFEGMNPHGMRGGMSERERRDEVKRRQRRSAA